jgi:hypothetical protein
MRAALGRLLANVRSFASGFLGLATAPPREPAAAREHFHHRATTNPPCC